MHTRNIYLVSKQQGTIRVDSTRVDRSSAFKVVVKGRRSGDASWKRHREFSCRVVNGEYGSTH